MRITTQGKKMKIREYSKSPRKPKEISKLVWVLQSNGTYKKILGGMNVMTLDFEWQTITFDPKEEHCLAKIVDSFSAKELDSARIELMLAIQPMIPSQYLLQCRFKKEINKNTKFKLMNIIYNPNQTLKKHISKSVSYKVF